MTTIRPLLLLACILAAPAAELTVRDVRLGVLTRPGDFDYELTSSTARSSGSDGFDAGLSLEGGVRWSLARTGDAVGLLVGADLAADALSYDGEDGLRTLWGRGAVGVGWAVLDHLTVTAEAMAGFGLSSLSLPGSAAAPAFDADGTALAYDGRLTASWQLRRDLNLGLAAGWLVSAHDLSGADTDITIDQSGWYAGLIMAWRITDVPVGLE